MAGEWIKLELSTLDKPEVLRVARKMGADKDLVIGKLFRLWAWFDANSNNGVVDGVVDADVDALVGLDGFCEQLKDVNWYASDAEQERAWLPNFDRHNSETAKKRADKSRRQAKWRKGKDADVDRGASTEASTREEKRREEEKKPPSPPAKSKTKAAGTPEDAPLSPPDGLPQAIDASLWTEFVKSRKALKKPMTTEAAKRLVVKLDRMTDQGIDASLALENSIINGWQGVFEPKEGGRHGAQGSRHSESSIAGFFEHFGGQD